MMGVVLWSDVNDEKAVFWCEDHGDLVYYDVGSQSQDKDLVFHPGDLVQFDVTIVCKTRRAMNARMVESNICKGLLDSLHLNIAMRNAETIAARSDGKVVLFRRKTGGMSPLRRCENG